LFYDWPQRVVEDGCALIHHKGTNYGFPVALKTGQQFVQFVSKKKVSLNDNLTPVDI